MDKRRLFISVILVLAMAVLFWGIDQGWSQSTQGNDTGPHYKGKITPAELKAAAARFKALRDSLPDGGVVSGLALNVGPDGYYIPDYYTLANWANSPQLTKFVDPLPGLYISGVSAAPAPGTQYIPVAVPDIATYPGADYYEIELGQYTQQMHSSVLMSPTTLRGYRQTNTADPVVSQFHYLGPVIIATKGTPVRIKFTNNLPFGPPDAVTGLRPGDLFLPVDTTIMGSGDFMIDYDPETKAPITPVAGTFTQNRATLHLHGGLNPWISDGTAHQWTAPVGETTPYAKGVSAAYVPDMWFDATGTHITEVSYPGSNCAGQTTCSVAGATNNPGAGKLTFYWTNEQSARFMFYHDHAYGITRLNVYAGEAAGYLINDPVEEDKLAAAGVPGTIGTTPGTTDLAHLIPLVIQDKTFVDAATVLTTDPTWASGTIPGKPQATPVTGDLWWPHVYMPAQNPYNPDLSGINAFGRWHYGPWFFPATPVCGTVPGAVPPYCIEVGPVPNPYCLPSPPSTCGSEPLPAFDCSASPLQPPCMPGTPSPSWGAEAFLDTMVVNGAAYPTLTIDPAKYRFRILNAAHDRFLNLQLYRASSIVSSITVDTPGTGYTGVVAVTITNAPGDTGRGATAEAVADLDPASPTYGQITAINLLTVGSGYTLAPTVTIDGGPGASGAAATAVLYNTALTEVGMVPAVSTPGFPLNWPKDGREGGAPDPATRGPAFVQIATEGGVLPAPVVLPNQPVNWNLDPTMFNVGNVLQQRDGGGTLFLGPAERADVIVDFTNFAGQTLILYNDAPTAFPALDPHYDYYTGTPDRTDMGGYIAIPPGVGPNVRTVMQIVVGGSGGLAPVDDVGTIDVPGLQAAFATDPATGAGIFASSQEPIVVGQTAYDSAYNTTFPATFPNWGVSRISDGAISFQQVDGTVISNFAMKPKAIHDEMGGTFDDYGRMSAKLGLEMPFVNAGIQNFILQNFVDPPTEIVESGQIQIWRITHNGVDTHPIHFHLFDVQVLNRVGWDGFIRLPDDNELGWKDTVRMAPLEDTIVALRPRVPPVPFALPNSIRPLNPTMPLGSVEGFSQIDITNGGNLEPPQTNQMYNFGYEYTWHCHILSHEENDMMRPTVLAVPPEAPSGLIAGSLGNSVLLTWTNNAVNATSLTIQRARDAGFTLGLTTFTLGMTATSYTDASISLNTTYYYRVFSTNTIGSMVAGPGIMSLNSAVSTTASINIVPQATASAPAVAWNSTAGQFQIALRASNNRIIVGTAQANGAFNNDWLQLPNGTTSAAPAIAWNPADGKVQIATKGNAANNVFVASYNAAGTGLSPWTLIPANSLSAPAVAWNATTGKLQMAIRGAGNWITVGTVNGNGTGFSGWTQLPTGRTSATPAITWNPTTNKVQIANKGNATNNIFVGNMNPDGTGLSAWVQLTGTTAVAPALTWNAAAGKVEIAIKGTNTTNVFKGSFNDNGTGFSGFSQVTGAVSTDSPAIAISPSAGTLNVFTRNGAGNLVEYITVP